MSKNTPSTPSAAEQAAAEQAAADQAAAEQAAAEQAAAEQAAAEQAAAEQAAAEQASTPAAVNFDEIPDGQILYIVAVYSNMVNLFTSQVYSKLPAKTPMDEFVRGQLKAEKLAIDPT